MSQVSILVGDIRNSKPDPNSVLASSELYLRTRSPKKTPQTAHIRLQVRRMFLFCFRHLPAAAIACILTPVCLGAEPEAGPLPLTESARRMTVPEGFRVSLFAGEPDVVQPIAMTTDERGRLWVVECLSYPDWQTNGTAGHDRVVILEDHDGDGKFGTKRVFFD